MRICLVTPVPPRSRRGNRITALRWAGILRELGHTVTVAQEYRGQPCDALIALHAVRSHPSIRSFAEERTGNPVIVALTGTDLYGDIHTDASAQQSLEMAHRFIVLQPMGIEELPERLRDKARVIYQSVKPPA